MASHAVALALVLLVAATPARTAELREQEVHFGGLAYRLFCAGCHGADGKGNGSLAEALEMQLGDLTQLAKADGGVFPAERVAAGIAGRVDVPGHRALAMAPWGGVFAGEFEAFATKMAVDGLVARRIDHIVTYLESIQEK